jgi:ABC-2 type transport system ATP-binding protein
VIGYESRKIRPMIGYVPDSFGAYEDMVVQEYLEFFAAAYGITGKAREQVVHDVLELTDLAFKRDALVNGLSRGMQQRLSLARVLLHDPKVLLLDEPASGLDPRARIERGELIFSGTVAEAVRRSRTGTILHVDVTTRIAEAAALLGRLRGVKEATQQDGHIQVSLESDAEDISAIARALLDANIGIREIRPEPVNLETAFMRLTKGLVQ